MLVPLMVYRSVRRRVGARPVRSPEYLLALAGASLLAAVILTGIYRIEPLFSGFLGHPGATLTAVIPAH